MSGPAALLDKLKSLARSDLAKFKEVMAKVSSTLKEDAKASSNPKEQKMLADLASRFETAGQTGDVSKVLTPPSGGHGHGGGGGGVGKSCGGASSTSSTEAADTNKDGKVSEEERAAFEAVQAAKQSAPSSGARAYAKQAGADEKGKMNEVMSRIMGMVDASADADADAAV